MHTPCPLQLFVQLGQLGVLGHVEEMPVQYSGMTQEVALKKVTLLHSTPAV